MRTMDIYYLGLSSFLIKGKNVSVVTDPFDEDMVGLKYPRIEADIITVSHDHGDHNAVANILNAKNIFSGPGEYEAGGVSFIGLPSYHDNKKGELRGKNTIFVIEIDGLRVGHLGDLGHPLSEKQLGDIGDLDIVMIPVGGVYTIDTDEALEMARSIGAHVTIPMHYKMKDLEKETFMTKLSTPDDFVTRIGLTSETVNKLTLRSELINEDQKVVLLERR